LSIINVDFNKYIFIKSHYYLKWKTIKLFLLTIQLKLSKKYLRLNESNKINKKFRFSIPKKVTDIKLSNDNRTAIHTGKNSHITILGEKDYSEGIISWKIKINSMGEDYKNYNDITITGII